ncbi:hypothetical protein [Oceanobacillus sp. CFH 90083]|uniref:hypothetical protein n=1 Tax=Oceanobacillus sp. CFH 90083 TaxID=2592336 RepID=UPI00128D9AF1|nr:hypothetical protein [Oceanobacillus sp. CFH 90083]
MRCIKYCWLFFIFIILVGCSRDEITEEDLIGGKWESTAEFDGNKAVGEPDCHLFDKGLEFKRDGAVYVDFHERDFEYWIRDKQEINFNDSSVGRFMYEIEMINEDELELTGIGLEEGRACHLERQY